MLKNLPANVGDAGNVGLTPGPGSSPGDGNVTPVRTAAIQKSTSSKCWRGDGEKGPSYTVLGNATSTATMENSVEIP